jgi:hypothetical protein
VGYEPIDAEIEAQQEAVYHGVLEDYRNSDSYYEDINRGIDEFIADRQKSYFLENPLVAQPAFDLLTEARGLLLSKHYAAAQIIAGAAAEVTFGNVLLKPMVYGFVHSDTVAQMVADIVENARSVFKFKTLLVAIVSQFSGIDLIAPDSSGKSLWNSVDDVRSKRNAVLHGNGLTKVTNEEAEQALAVATMLIETVFPAVVGSLGLHLHGIEICAKACSS